MAKCNQLTSLPFKGLTQTERRIRHWRVAVVAMTTTWPSLAHSVFAKWFRYSV